MQKGQKCSPTNRGTFPHMTDHTDTTEADPSSMAAMTASGASSVASIAPSATTMVSETVSNADDASRPGWYAVRTRQDFKAEAILAGECEDVYFPKEIRRTPGGIKRLRAVIPHVLFVRTTRPHILELEARSRRDDWKISPLWVYRNHRSSDIHRISEREMRLLQLLTTDSPERCEVYTQTDYTPGQRVRVTGGIYEGYTGTVQRVRKNRHVVVSIEGVCLILLPYIHPDLLSPLP